MTARRWDLPGGVLITADSTAAFVRFAAVEGRRERFIVRTVEEVARAVSAATRLLAPEHRPLAIRTIGDAWERHIDEACAAAEARAAAPEIHDTQAA